VTPRAETLKTLLYNKEHVFDSHVLKNPERVDFFIERKGRGKSNYEGFDNNAFPPNVSFQSEYIAFHVIPLIPPRFTGRAMMVEKVWNFCASTDVSLVFAGRAPEKVCTLLHIAKESDINTILPSMKIRDTMFFESRRTFTWRLYFNYIPDILLGATVQVDMYGKLTSVV
jgi:hypothetical protein